MHGFLTQTISYAGNLRNRLNTPEVEKDLKNQKKSAVLKEGFYLTMIGVFVSSKLYLGSKNPNLDNRTLIPVAIFLSLYVLMCLYRAQNVIGAVNNPKLSRLDESVRVLTNCREQLESFPILDDEDRSTLSKKPHRL